MRRRAGIHSILGRITGYGYAETAPIRRLAAALLFAEDPPVKLSESGSLSGWSGLWGGDVPSEARQRNGLTVRVASFSDTTRGLSTTIVAKSDAKVALRRIARIISP
jgi:hypothetical protein